MGALNPDGHEFDKEKFLQCRTQGLQVDFDENFNFAPLR